MPALRFLGGAALAFFVWWTATLFYDGLLGFSAERLLSFDKRLCGPHLIADDRKIEVHPRLCVAPTGTVPADQLTYNIILLGGLFAMRWRSVAAFLTSLFVVAVTHVLSLAVSVESAYARVGAWSERHYSSLEQDIWVSTEFWWRLVGMFAIVFVCWWLTQAPEQGRRREPRRRPASRSSLPS